MMSSQINLITEIIGCRMNYAFSHNRGNIHRLVSNYYKMNGWEGFLSHLIKEEKRLKLEYYTYYSENLQGLVERAIDEITEEALLKYIEHNILAGDFIYKNLIKLKEFELQRYIYNFSSGFRGFITKIHSIGNYKVVETKTNKEEINFYVAGNFTNVYRSLEEALIVSIYDYNYTQTLFTLLESVRNEPQN